MTDKTPTPIPEPGEGKRGESGYLGYLLRQASSAVRLGMERLFEDLDVTTPQFLVMTMINAYPGISSADVARLAQLTPQTISLIVANLEKSGRLTRVVSPTHGRIQQMALTEEGKTLLAECRERTAINAVLSARVASYGNSRGRVDVGDGNAITGYRSGCVLFSKISKRELPRQGVAIPIQKRKIRHDTTLGVAYGVINCPAYGDE